MKMLCEIKVSSVLLIQYDEGNGTQAHRLVDRHAIHRRIYSLPISFVSSFEFRARACTVKYKSDHLAT